MWRVVFAGSLEWKMISVMPRQQGRVHVVRVRKTHVDKRGQRRQSTSVYLRRTYRDGAAVRNETVANLSMLPLESVDAIEATLKGQTLVPAGSEFSIVRSLPHGHVAAVAAVARQLGLPALLGPAGRRRDLVLALIVSRVIRPGSKLSTLAWWPDTTLATDLGVAGASTDEIYAAMDWLAGRQGAIEKKLAAKHLAVAHRAARPGDRQIGRRRRPAEDEPFRHPGPGRDHPPRLPRRTADRLPQPRAGRRTRP
jgi:hypothetical protein